MFEELLSFDLWGVKQRSIYHVLQWKGDFSLGQRKIKFNVYIGETKNNFWNIKMFFFLYKYGISNSIAIISYFNYLVDILKIVFLTINTVSMHGHFFLSFSWNWCLDNKIDNYNNTNNYFLNFGNNCFFIWAAEIKKHCIF